MLQVKIFDCEHEEDLEKEINTFFKKLPEPAFISIHYATSHFSTEISDQIFGYSALILYREGGN